MRECCYVWAAITTAALTIPDLEQYGVRLLFSLPLGMDLDDTRRYLVVVSGFARVVRNSDVMFELLNDALQPVRARVYSCQRVGYYFEEV